MQLTPMRYFKRAGSALQGGAVGAGLLSRDLPAMPRPRESLQRRNHSLDPLARPPESAWSHAQIATGNPNSSRNGGSGKGTAMRARMRRATAAQASESRRSSMAAPDGAACSVTALEN